MPTFNTSTTANATSTATSYTSTTRWNYITVENEGTSSIFIRTDGTTATSGGDGTYEVAPGQALTFSNDLAYWNQAYGTIPAGTLTGVLGSGKPPEIQPYGSSLQGGTTNPGSSVSVILVTAGTTGPFTISAAG